MTAPRDPRDQRPTTPYREEPVAGSQQVGGYGDRALGTEHRHDDVSGDPRGRQGYGPGPYPEAGHETVAYPGHAGMEQDRYGGYARPRNGLGIAALVLGILALLSSWTVVGGLLLGLGAIILGVMGRGRAKRGIATNKGMATAGLVLGVLAVLLSGALVAAGVSLFHSDAGKNLQDCLKNANGQSQINACNQKFQKDVSNK